MNFAMRLDRLGEPHILPLQQFRQRLLESLPAGCSVPNFDPDDAGAKARVLLLLETPGRVPRKTGFTSLDNPSATSSNLRPLVEQSGLPRKALLMWNLVPWDIGLEHRVQPTTAVHHAHGIYWLRQLVVLLQDLRAIIFIGRKAQTAIPEIARWHPSLVLLTSPHPSPANVIARPGSRLEISAALAAAAALARD